MPKKSEFYRGGNFHTEAEETAHMMYLRDNGYNNKDIGKACGRSAVCVWHRIGRQPKAYTKLSMKRVGELRHQRCEDRKENAKRYKIQKQMIANQQKIADEADATAKAEREKL